MNPVLQAKNVSRYFGKFQAIQPVEFELPAGEIVVLIGPNGAGKTTLLNCLSGLLRPSTGNVLVEGFDLYKDEMEAKKRMAYVPDVPHFYQELTTWEHMHFICLAFGTEQQWEERAEKLLREFSLWESRDLYPHNLSRGMQLKLGISLALVRPFKVLLMDEPTSALDLESSNNLIESLINLRDHGCAIMISSHDQSLAQRLGSRSWRMEAGNLRMS